MASWVGQHLREPQSGYDLEEPTPARHRYENQTISDIPVLEWIIGALGFAVVAGVIAFLFYDAITTSPSPPDVDVSVISVAQVRSAYLVEVKTLNHGGSTAAGVVIRGELRKGPDVLEQSHATLDYLPQNSEKQVGLFFTRDPRKFDLQVRALGYVEP
jgi:uncharacterized protein (TIGR02588 family)